ncbi:Panacea domain-containing protein [Alicyclobacillus macrosporangiidus]|uniref:Panacea domain-containing protein n=1 Tax=Alicyclobacillus macrosporangiidus TaxID=392015 RepID=UPI001FE404ED|nr:type II toxin-antitoxin system antitoxin SocA domain-containing protein [Alicyclobacillus macrosporangiidus]
MAAKMSVMDVAKYFLNKSRPGTKWAITHLKLQKLVYYAQAWYLALRHELLFDEELEAWAHGPVSPTVYMNYRAFGYREIPPYEDDIKVSDEVKAVLDAVWEVYGHRSARWLEQKTHMEDPWIQARKGTPNGSRSRAVIDTRLMEQYYSSLLKSS